MIFGPSLLKEVDSPAISKMGPTFPKVAERGPKCKEAPRRRIWSPRAKVWNQYTYRVFLSRLGRGVGGEGPGAEGVGGGKPPPFQDGLTRPTEGRRILALWAPFGFPLAHFGLTLGALWLTFGALGITFAHLALNFLTFGVPWRHF